MSSICVMGTVLYPDVTTHEVTESKTSIN